MTETPAAPSPNGGRLVPWLVADALAGLVAVCGFGVLPFAEVDIISGGAAQVSGWGGSSAPVDQLRRVVVAPVAALLLMLVAAVLALRDSRRRRVFIIISAGAAVSAALVLLAIALGPAVVMVDFESPDAAPRGGMIDLYRFRPMYGVFAALGATVLVAAISVGVAYLSRDNAVNTSDPGR